MHQFEAFAKIPRFFRDVTISEKIDGTNAQVFVSEDGTVMAGSRSRWITPESDNFGFAAWVAEHENELRELGPGRHFGEWYGRGIQRGYGLQDRRFALFNSHRWAEKRPACCDVVPVMATRTMDGNIIGECLETLRSGGSLAAPGFMRPEGIVIYHHASGGMFKVLLENDELPKGVRDS